MVHHHVNVVQETIRTHERRLPPAASGHRTATGTKCSLPSSALSSSLLSLLLLFLAASLPTAFGQISTAVHTSITTPDFSNPRLVFNLVLLCLWVPIGTLVVIFVYRRRARFPLAGRGSSMLLVLGSKQVFASAVLSILSILYPVGAPCGLQFLLYFAFSTPAGIIYLLRGLKLVFRLEIMNFLTETRWREEKRTMLLEHEATLAERDTPPEGSKTDAAEESSEDGGNSPTAASSDDGVTKITVKPAFSEEPDDPASIPGHFFIMHRHWIEPAFTIPWVLGAIGIIVTGMLFVAAFDPDIDFTNSTFHSRGLLPEDESLGTQFAPDTFGSSPVCLVYSIKILLFQALLALTLFPGVKWCVWRIIIDGRRQAARKKDQAEVYRYIHGEDMPPATVTAGIDLDDAGKVKIELFVVFLITSGSCVFYYPVQMYEPGYGLTVLLAVNILTFIASLARPLQISFSVQRRLRDLFDPTRSRSTSNASAGKKGDNEALQKLPHHRPYFTLKYVIKQPHTYPVLLTFLQKEFSSENALFYAEARDFERAAKSLESRISSWPNANDDEDTGITRTGRSSQQGGAGSMIGSGALSRGLISTTAASSAAPNLLRVASSTMVVQSSDGSTVEAPLAAGAGAGSAVQMVQTQVTVTPAISTNTTPSATPVSPIAPSGIKVVPLITPLTTPFQSPGTHPTRVLLQATPSSLLGSGDRQTSLEFPLVSTPLGAAAAPTLSFAPILPPPVDFAFLRAEAHRIKTWALKMSDDYLIRSAMYEINIPEDIMKLVTSQVTQLTSWEPTPTLDSTGQVIDPTCTYPSPPPFPLSTLFKQAQLEVFDLIQRDSFRRFVITPDFARLLKQADEAELARLERAGNIATGTKDALDKAMLALTTPVAGSPGGATALAGPRSRSGSQPNQLGVVNSVNGGGGGHSRRRTDDEFALVPLVEEDVPLPGTPASPAAPTTLMPSTRAGSHSIGPTYARRTPARYSRVDEESISDSGSPLTRPPRAQAYRPSPSSNVRQEGDMPEPIVAFSLGPSAHGDAHARATAAGR